MSVYLFTEKKNYFDKKKEIIKNFFFWLNNEHKMYWSMDVNDGKQSDIFPTVKRIGDTKN